MWSNHMFSLTIGLYSRYTLQFQYTPQHLVRLLQIIVDNNCDIAVRQAASIHFKNFIARNWSPDDPGMIYFCFLSNIDHLHSR